MIQIDEHSIHLKVEGSGTSVVLLHGWGQNMEMMMPIFDHLKTYCKVMVLDLPGFGKSDRPDVVWTTTQYAQVIHELLIKHQMDEKPILIAHSFGARIAFRYALNYDCGKMILTGAAGIKDHHGLTYYARVYAYKLMKKLHMPQAKEMGSRDFQDSDSIMRGILVAAVNEDITPYLKEIQNETLLVWGTKDNQTPLWMGKKMEKEMPNAGLALFSGDDHFAYYHQMRRFLNVIDYFLKGETS